MQQVWIVLLILVVLLGLLIAPSSAFEGSWGWDRNADSRFPGGNAWSAGWHSAFGPWHDGYSWYPPGSSPRPYPPYGSGYDVSYGYYYPSYGYYCRGYRY
jgi:hypothetical protein